MPVEPETGEALPATIDADRLRKYLARFELSWERIRQRESGA